MSKAQFTRTKAELMIELLELHSLIKENKLCYSSCMKGLQAMDELKACSITVQMKDLSEKYRSEIMTWLESHNSNKFKGFKIIK